MSHVDRTAAAIAMVAVLGGGCSGGATMMEGERAEDRATSLSEQDESSPGESDRDGDGRSVEDAEESGAELTLNEAYEDIRNGVRLTLTYDAGDNAFSGAVENTTTETLRQVRVEVHLSNEQELAYEGGAVHREGGHAGHGRVVAGLRVGREGGAGEQPERAAAEEEPSRRQVQPPHERAGVRGAGGGTRASIDSATTGAGAAAAEVSGRGRGGTAPSGAGGMDRAIGH